MTESNDPSKQPFRFMSEGSGSNAIPKKKWLDLASEGKVQLVPTKRGQNGLHEEWTMAKDESGKHYRVRFQQRRDTDEEWANVVAVSDEEKKKFLE